MFRQCLFFHCQITYLIYSTIHLLSHISLCFSAGSGISSVESTIVVVGIITTVFVSVMIIFICGLRRRCSGRRQRAPSLRTQQSLTLAPEEEVRIPEPPPSYDEAMQSSRTSLPTLPSYVPSNSQLGINYDNDSIPSFSTFPRQNEDEYSTRQSAYDDTGLPSYREAHRLSRESLDRDVDNTSESFVV